MKHGFIFGTSLYLSRTSTISYGVNRAVTTFLTIVSFFKQGDAISESVVVIDADFSLLNGEAIKIVQNKIVEGTSARVHVENNRVTVFHVGHEIPVLDVFQMDEHAFHGLGSNTYAEIESQKPDVVFTIKCNLMVDDGVIWVENEKLHIDEAIFASGIFNEHHGVILSADEWSY